MTRIILITLLLFMGWSHPSRGQGIPALSFDIKKPANLENKKLGSEKTGEKKFTLPRHFLQNTVTHYNWHFNAQEKLNEIIARAKDGFRDDYTKLLTFHNYTTEATARDTLELDSVIYKANAGILLHDLRNDWIDNMYMLLGKAYYLKQEYDTAFLTFQYINYAFSPKEKDGYDKTIGSNANEGGNAFSISTPENRSLLKKMISHNPSRNESFLWLIRTYLAREEYPEAAGLIETLKNDPAFPARLHPALHEMQALWFYQQNLYDSTAVYLERALPVAQNLEEKARWEYLIGQLYERSNKPDQALAFFNRAVMHTLNPILEVYARLNSIRQNKGDEKAIAENIAALVKMAKRDRYINYRDIIYYSAAQMELERNNTAAAKQFLLLSAQSGSEFSADRTQKSRSFLQLGDLSFDEGNYSDARKYYDSVQNKELIDDQEAFDKRQSVLTRMGVNSDIIYRQDSLQHIAGMPEAERDALLKKLVKKIRKAQGMQEEPPVAVVSTTGALTAPGTTAPTAAVSFDNNAKGEWYFYNTSLKSKGLNEFKALWGNRPNVDNWRRSTAVSQSLQQTSPDQTAIDAKAQAAAAPSGVTYNFLLMGLPLTEEKMKVSNDSIEQAQFEIGKALMEGLEDYPRAIQNMEAFRTRFPESKKDAEVLASLYYCYMKMGETAKALEVKRILESRHKDSEFEKKVQPESTAKKDPRTNADMTRRYEKIYTLFIEGSFDQALAEKRAADQLYQKNYWTPQLLYIQSIYYIRQRQDDTAKAVLNDIMELFPGTEMAEKAKTMAEVLARRQQIEQYLNDLKVERPSEETITVPDEPAVVAPTPGAPPPVVTPAAPAEVTDTTTRVPQDQQAQADAVARILAQPRPAPAAKDTQAAAPAPAPVVTQKAVDKPKADTATQKPAVVTTRPEAPAPQRKDTTAVAQKPAPPAPTGALFTVDPSQPHYVMIMLDKVDGVFVNEARNAFNRWNKQNLYNKPLEVTSEVYSETIRFILVQSFPNAGEAMAYMENVRSIAATAIVPWLPAEKYSFALISDKNLTNLRYAKALEAYRNFLKTTYPGKF